MCVGGGRAAAAGAGASGRVYGPDAPRRPHRGGRAGHHSIGQPPRWRTVRGLAVRPGVLPRLLGVPASELRDERVPFRDLRPVPPHRTLVDLTVALASDEPTTETAPWSLSLLSHV